MKAALISSSCQPADHEADAGDGNPGNGAFDGCLDILCRTAAASRPGEGMLHHPAAGRQSLPGERSRSRMQCRQARSPLRCTAGARAMNRDWSDAGVWGARVIPAISTGRKGVASAAASTLSCSGEKRGSFSHLKIRFAFITYRRATCATDTPGINAYAQIKRFSASNQNRFFPTMTRLKMSTIDGGHYQALPTRSRPPTLDAYPRTVTPSSKLSATICALISSGHLR